MSARRNVYLIGQPGVGKTTLGRIVAERLGKTFFDLDQETERFHGKSLDDLSREALTTYGFRDCKVRALLSFARTTRNAVIAVSSDGSRDRRVWKLMRDNGITIHLFAEPAEVHERCPAFAADGHEMSHEEKKPCARQQRSLYLHHRPFYERADRTMNITGLNVASAAERLTTLVREMTGDSDGHEVADVRHRDSSEADEVAEPKQLGFPQDGGDGG